MLNNKFTKDPNSVEEIFCVPFSNLPVRTMTKEESEMLVQLFMVEKHDALEKIDLEDDDVPFSVRMLKKSLEHRFTFDMNEPLQLMVSAIAGSAGGVIMYLTYLQYWAKKLNTKTLTLEKFANIFPMGFPTEKALQDIWESQKVARSEENPNGSDNLLDYPQAAKSIHFEVEQA